MAPGEANKAREAAADRIGALPDALLHRILSLLPAQQATRTCVLARRWVDLWKSTTGLRIVGADGKTAVKLQEVREFVDHLFLLRGTSPLDECEFHLHFVSDADVTRMNLWIRHALMCHVGVLRLYTHGLLPANILYKYPPLVSRHLTRLQLRNIWFSNQFLNFMRCPALQDLQIADCSLWDVHKISSQSLKHLKIFECSFSDGFRILIHAPSLVSLQLQVFGGITPVLDAMPLLVEAVVDLCDSCEDRCCHHDESGNYCDETCEYCILYHGSCVLLQGLSQAKNLCLIADTETHFFRRDLKWCPTFKLLKKFILDEHWCMPDVSALSCILQHAPVLEELCLLLFSKGPKHNVQLKGSFNPEELSSTISAHLKRVEVKCEIVDERVVEVLRFLSKLNICFSFQEKV